MARWSCQSSQLQVVLIVVVAICVCRCNAATARNANVRQYSVAEVDAVLKSDRAVRPYIACLLDKGPCNGNAKQLRTLLPRALSTGCKDCTPNQMEISTHVIDHLRKNKPSDWARLAAKYDPKGEYEKKFSARTASRRA